MPTNTAQSDAAAAQTDWDVFMNNWAAAQATSNAIGLGRKLAGGLDLYRTNAEKALGYIATGLGKAGNVGFNENVATGKGFGFTLEAGMYGRDMSIAASDDPMESLLTFRDTTQTRISDLESILESGGEYTQNLLAGLDYEWAEGLSAGEFLSVIDKEIEHLNYRRVGVGLSDNLSAGEVHLEKTRATEEWAELRDLRERFLEAQSADSGSAQEVSTELGALREVLEDVELTIERVQGIADSIMGEDGIVGNDPITSNMALNLTSGSGMSNVGVAITELEIGRRNLRNEGITAIGNMVGNAVMSDNAAAFAEEIGTFTQEGIDFQERVQRIQTMFTAANFGLGVIGLF